MELILTTTRYLEAELEASDIESAHHPENDEHTLTFEETDRLQVCHIAIITKYMSTAHSYILLVF